MRELEELKESVELNEFKTGIELTAETEGAAKPVEVTEIEGTVSSLGCRQNIHDFTEHYGRKICIEFQEPIGLNEPRNIRCTWLVVPIKDVQL